MFSNILIHGRVMLKVLICSSFTVNNSLYNYGMMRNYYSSGSIVKAMKRIFAPRDGVLPPYDHVCQIGDPVLRVQAEPVDAEVIPTVQFQKFIDHLIGVMRKYNAFGLSASQIGSPVQVFVMETTHKNYKESFMCAGQPMQVIPLRIFINPVMMIRDYKTFTFPEACASICGYTAHVPRAKGIQIKALDLSGKPFVWDADGWPARVAQHEMDHLQGKMFTDKMDPKTFSCTVWETVNRKSGKIGIDFCPGNRSKIKKILYS